MEDLISYIVLGAFILGVIYFGIRRLKDSKNEDFEDRDN